MIHDISPIPRKHTPLVSKCCETRGCFCAESYHLKNRLFFNVYLCDFRQTFSRLRRKCIFSAFRHRARQAFCLSLLQSGLNTDYSASPGKHPDPNSMVVRRYKIMHFTGQGLWNFASATQIRVILCVFRAPTALCHAKFRACGAKNPLFFDSAQKHPLVSQHFETMGW